jgi:hypothetical protein
MHGMGSVTLAAGYGVGLEPAAGAHAAPAADTRRHRTVRKCKDSVAAARNVVVKPDTAELVVSRRDKPCVPIGERQSGEIHCQYQRH